jgi:hypothetical protein
MCDCQQGGGRGRRKGWYYNNTPTTTTTTTNHSVLCLASPFLDTPDRIAAQRRQKTTSTRPHPAISTPRLIEPQVGAESYETAVRKKRSGDGVYFHTFFLGAGSSAKMLKLKGLSSFFDDIRLLRDVENLHLGTVVSFPNALTALTAPLLRCTTHIMTY